MQIYFYPKICCTNYHDCYRINCRLARTGSSVTRYRGFDQTGSIYPGDSNSFPTSERYLESHRRFGSDFFAMMSEDNVIAVAVANHGSSGSTCTVLQDIAVHPERRREGNGRAMVLHVARRALSIGSESLMFSPSVRTSELSVPFFNSVSGAVCKAGLSRSINIETLLRQESI